MAIAKKHHSNQNNKNHLTGHLNLSYSKTFSISDVLSLYSRKNAFSTQFSIQPIFMTKEINKPKPNTPNPPRSFVLDNFHFHKDFHVTQVFKTFRGNKLSKI